MDKTIYMTEEEAENIILANEVGRYSGERSKLAHAHLLLAARDKRYEEEDAANKTQNAT